MTYNNDNKEPTLATMNEVVVKKQDLLTRLIENKAKHDVILATAISGYWELAQTMLQRKEKELNEKVAEWQGECGRTFEKYYTKVEKREELPQQVSISTMSLNLNLGLVYPEDHSQDYERAIRMMQMSVFDEVKLTVSEFDAYVMNNWEWKRNFLLSNRGYVDSIRLKGVMCSGMSAPSYFTGCYSDTYANATVMAMNSFAGSGINSF
jgi:hypothetical protein